MIEKLPLYVSIIFIATTLLTLYFLIVALRHSISDNIKNKIPKISIIAATWLALQALLALTRVHKGTTASVPNLILLGIIPTVIIITYLFATEKGRGIVRRIPLKYITYIHLVRVPVEIILYLLFYYTFIPEDLTFTGLNFDIIIGLTAPIIIYYGFHKKRLSRNTMLAWNVLGLAFLLNVVVHAILSTPFKGQLINFDQPNIAMFYFPFVWLPTFIVPLVLFSHLVSIYKLRSSGNRYTHSKPRRKRINPENKVY